MRFMQRRVACCWMLPTLLLGIDLGWRLSAYRGTGLIAQSPGGAADLVPVAPAVPGSEADSLQKAYAAFEPVNAIFQKAARTMSPSVVHIVARKGAGEGGEQVEESGSGVIVATNHPGQYVLTNNHVVMDAKPKDIQVHLSDGRVISPERVWADESGDIAVMRMAADAPKLTPAVMGDSDDVPVGTWVLAVGSPFGLTHSVSHGIISARGRHEMELFQDGVENQDFLQTDAAINPGNSGGPLVNLKGEVIGINTAIASQGGGSEGVGFTIPINLARWIMDQLLANGRVQRGAMGVDLDDVPVEVAKTLGLERPKGALITAVHPDSPAMRAGLKSRDVIIGFESKPVNDLNHLINLVSMTPVGRPVELQVWRDRGTMRIRVTVGERDRILAKSNDEKRPEPPRAGPDKPSRPPSDKPKADALVEGPWGLSVRTLSESASRQMGLQGKTFGAVVVRVDAGSPFARELAPGDVITAVNGKRFAEASGLMDALRMAIDEVPGDKPNETGRSLEVEVLRAVPGQPIQVYVLKVDA